MMTFGNGIVPVGAGAGVTFALAPGYDSGNANVNPSALRVVIPQDCQVDRLSLSQDGSRPANESIKAVVFINGVSTDAAITLAGNVSTGTDVAAASPIAAGDTLQVFVSTDSGLSVTANEVVATVRFAPP